MDENTIIKFGPTVKYIKEPGTNRFLLTSYNSERLDYYPVFEENEKKLLCLYEGITLKQLRQIFSKNKADEYVNFFRRNGYFDSLKNGIDFTKRIRQDHDNHHRSMYNYIDIDIENKLKSYHLNQTIPWSKYKAPPGTASIEVSLFITDICNLGCKYCHVIDNIESKKKKFDGKIMSQVTLELFTKNFFGYIKNRFKTGSLSICFFGGQPSLKGYVRQFLYKAADYIAKEGAKEKIYIKFIIDDNGTQIDDDLIKFYKHYGFEVNLSFDAPADVNSFQRPFLNSRKQNSGKVIEDNLKKLLDNGIDTGVRATVSNLNQNRILESIEKYSQWGLTSAAFIPMQDIAHGKKVCDITAPDPEIFKDELIKTFDFVLDLYETKQIFFDFGPITALLDSIISGGTVQPCGMGDVYFALSPDGEVFTCHRDLIPEYFVSHLNDPEFLQKMKNISENKKCSSFYTLLDPENLCSNQTCSCKIKQKISCCECEVLAFCGGSCPAASVAQYGCENWGVSILLDSDPVLKENRCKWSKELITYFLWKYLNANDLSTIRKYAKEIHS